MPLAAGPGKQNVWIEAGIHAREWISPAMSTYIIDSLINNDVDNFTSQMNFYVLPSANPDGYQYSREHVIYFSYTRGQKSTHPISKALQ